MRRFPDLCAEQLVMQCHNMVQNRLLNLDEETRSEGVALCLRQATQGMRIMAFRQVRQVANHGGTDATEINGVHAKGLEEMIAFNIAEDHRVTGFRRILLEVKQHRAGLTSRDVEQGVDRLLQRWCQ